MGLLSESLMTSFWSADGFKLGLWFNLGLCLFCQQEVLTFINDYSRQSRAEAAVGQRSKGHHRFIGTTSHICLHQKMFAGFTAEGIPVIETSTLTEEGVMQVKTEVRQKSVHACCRPSTWRCWCCCAHHGAFVRPVIASLPPASRRR